MMFVSVLACVYYKINLELFASLMRQYGVRCALISSALLRKESV
jgi:hypothetical protein